MKSNRHKKLKAVDPFYTGDRKLFIDKRLIYANQSVGKDEDEQKIPVKMREYLELNKKLKEKRETIKKEKGVNKLKKNKEIAFVYSSKPDDRGAEVAVRPTPDFKKLQNESESAFLNRIDQEVALVINRVNYETQFDCKLETKDDKVIIKKDKKMSERKKKQLGKLKEKLKYEKEKKNEDDGFHTKDKVIKFGEIAHQPPALVLPKLRQKHAANAAYIDSLNKAPGKKDLLLKQQLNECPEKINIVFTDPSQRSKINIKSSTKTSNNKTITEADRIAVMESYRNLKKTGKIK